MVELELLGLHDDGEHLTLSDTDGQRYRLTIDDALRAAVRRDRPALGALRTAGGSMLPPKEIQAFIRAGATVEEVAERAGLSVERVAWYEGPVLAERDWIVQRAQAQRIGHEPDAPSLGDLVIDRLAARGVDTAGLEWDAVRRPGRPWEVTVSFAAGERERLARWQVDLGAHSLHAMDDESRWLSETEMVPAPRRHRTAVGHPRAVVGDLRSPAAPSAVSPRSGPESGESAADGAAHPPTEPATTDTLLAELAVTRGRRGEVQPELDLDLDDEDGGPWGQGAHPAASRPEDATDAHVLALPRRPSVPGGRRHPAGSALGAAPGTTPALPADQDPDTTRTAAGTRGAPSGRSATSGRSAADLSPSADAAASRDVEHPAPRAPHRPRKGARRSVPSWDEIVFGAKPE
ncbi:septation protein SepH [Georgenia sp.]